MREKALKWFRELTLSEREFFIEKWKQQTTHFAKSWSNNMISASSSMIERIYREIIQEENFKN